MKPFSTGIIIFLIFVVLNSYLKRIQNSQEVYMDAVDWMAENYVYHPGVFAGMFAAGMASVGMTLCDVFIQILIN